ncbi:MAG: TlyA family RNA methyltransferase [Propionibacteriaceae bacterium]
MSGSARLDLELVRLGLARSRAHAQQLIDAGRVRLNGKVADKAAARVTADDTLRSESDGYVSRAAHKLSGALTDLGLRPAGRALDAGASTGGFTQVLLERGCDPVYAVDVGTDQLAAELREDPRVVVWEQTNLRDLELRHVGGRPVDLVVADVSFISLVLLVPRLVAVTRPDGRLLLMVKPQFEVGRARLGKGGVVRSAELRRRAVDGVVAEAARYGWSAEQVVASRLPGPAGNVEYFVLFGPERPGAAPVIVSPATYAVPGE